MVKLLNKKQRGFTLIEVLIAGFILIIVISAMTFVYRTSVISSIKASKSVKLSGSVNLIASTIKNKIRNTNATSPLTGEGSIDGVNYKWHTELLSNKGAPPRFDAEGGSFESQQSKFFLWQVQLTVTYKTLSKNFQFKEVSWNNY